MATIYSEFLLHKFVKDFQEEEKVRPDLPLKTNFKEICKILQKKKFIPQDLIAMKEWLYEINDALAECNRMEEDRMAKRRLAPTRTGKDLWYLYKTGQKMSRIRDKLHNMDEAVEEGAKTSQVLVIHRKNMIYDSDSPPHRVFNQQDIKLEILLRPTKGNCAIGIVGMSGSGKSEIAMKLFLNSKMEEVFELMLWVDLSKAMDSEQKYECILVEKRNEFEKISSNSRSGFELCRLLKEDFLNPPRKCLVVFDGVWHVIDGLNSLIEEILNSPMNGSVIITSKSPRVVKKLLPKEKSYLHNIELLSRDHCWNLFRNSIVKKLFLKTDLKKNILKMKDEILDRCNGLPLAVKTLAEIIAIQIGKEEYWTDENIIKEIHFRVVVYDHHTLNKITDLLGGGLLSIKYSGGYEIYATTNNPIALLKKMGHICFTELLGLIPK
ncbi:Disease resistance RPP13-like protein 4 [Abeliophyllum distichum]|uniref:Disease resistance RPP13-like protein 4 n=1 Tax=Abeliophyllum distichum TaxID=126358 RepID=A0ABD1QUE7_9LAMI